VYITILNISNKYALLPIIIFFFFFFYYILNCLLHSFFRERIKCLLESPPSLDSEPSNECIDLTMMSVFLWLMILFTVEIILSIFYCDILYNRKANLDSNFLKMFILEVHIYLMVLFSKYIKLSFNLFINI